jgi:hypothetical protein
MNLQEQIAAETRIFKTVFPTQQIITTHLIWRTALFMMDE